MNIEFTGRDGSFRTKEADKASYLCLPVGSPSGVMGSVTPRGGGDTKLSQDRFLLPPVVVEDGYRADDTDSKLEEIDFKF